MRTFRAERAGRYVLLCSGYDAQRDWSGYELLVTRPQLLKAAASIVCLLGGSYSLLAGLWLLVVKAGVLRGFGF